jgi:hypothetical protein
MEQTFDRAFQKGFQEACAHGNVESVQAFLEINSEREKIYMEAAWKLYDLAPRVELLTGANLSKNYNTDQSAN